MKDHGQSLKSQAKPEDILVRLKTEQYIRRKKTKCCNLLFSRPVDTLAMNLQPYYSFPTNSQTDLWLLKGCICDVTIGNVVL